MEIWLDLIKSGDIPTILILLVIALLTGGVAVALINGFVASRRGVKGDALQKENNAISGLGTLTEGQQGFIDALQQNFNEYKAEMETKFAKLELRLDLEIAYNNMLITQLITAQIAPIQRPSDK